MKFALLTTNLAGGGAEKALAKIGSGLAGRGHEVDFIVCEDTGKYSPPPAAAFTYCPRAPAMAGWASGGWPGNCTG